MVCPLTSNDMKTFLLMLSVLSLGILTGCSATENPEQETQNETASFYENAQHGFRVSYPVDLVLDGNEIWIQEDWDFKESQTDPTGYAGRPLVTIEAENLNGLTLEEYVIQDHDLGDSKTLEATGAFNQEESPWNYENQQIGANEFLRVEIPEHYHVIKYYTVHEDVVVSFLMYFLDDDNETVKEIMASLEFYASETLEYYDWHLDTQGEESTLFNDVVERSVPEGWEMIDGGDFTLYAPANWEFTEGMGIDSYVGEIAGDGVVLHFDYGMYTGNFAASEEETYDIQYEIVSGQKAVIFTPKTTGEGLTGIYVEAPRGEGNFTLYGENLTTEQEELAVQIFRTLKFKQ